MKSADFLSGDQVLFNSLLDHVGKPVKCWHQEMVYYGDLGKLEADRARVDIKRYNGSTKQLWVPLSQVQAI